MQPGRKARPGRKDGAAVVARLRSSASVDTPENGSQVTVPLTPNTWTQAAGEVDLLPFGQLTYVAPAADSCAATGFASLHVQVDVDGTSFFGTDLGSLLDGATRTVRFGNAGFLFEPAAASAHTATVHVSSVCLSVALYPKFTVSDLRFDVVRAS